MLIFYDWPLLIRDHVLEILLPIKERVRQHPFRIYSGLWNLPGFTGFGSHGEAIGNQIIGMYLWYAEKFRLNFKILWFWIESLYSVYWCFLCTNSGNFFNSRKSTAKPVEKSYGTCYKVRTWLWMTSPKGLVHYQRKNSECAYILLKKILGFQKYLEAIPYRASSPT